MRIRTDRSWTRVHCTEFVLVKLSCETRGSRLLLVQGGASVYIRLGLQELRDPTKT